MLKLQIDGWAVRPMQMADAGTLQAILSQYEVAKFLLPIKHPFPEGAAAAWLKDKLAHQTPQNTSFAILNPTGGVCGNVGFDEAGDKAHIGYYLDIPHWAQGIMTHAVKTVIEWLFDNSNVDLIRSGAFAFNAASLAIQRRHGFIETGYGASFCAAQKRALPHIDTELSRARFYKRQGDQNA